MADPASDEQLAAWIGDHPAWTYDAERRVLSRKLAFADFVAAFGFMTVVAIRAQELNHHPDWSNAYNAVEVELTTHSAEAVTENDFALGSFMDEWAGRHGAKDPD
jgi:4a-hydroxytetrahydrobiopterin dehydratase